MRTILVIGIGTGSPEQLTVAAIAALNRADAIFLPDKGEEKGELLALRRAILERYVTREGTRAVPYAVPQRNAALPDYDQGVDQWHEALAGIFTDLIARLGADETGAFLVWGDPGLYDSTLRILGKVPIPMEIRVIPGISAVQALTAAHGIALNRIGEPVLITTGRRLEPGDTDVVVMLDGKQSFLHADRTSTSSGAPISVRPTKSSFPGASATCATGSSPPAPRPASAMAGSWTPIFCASATSERRLGRFRHADDRLKLSP